MDNSTKTYSQCQSCGMPLNDTNHGVEADGSKSNKFCSLCYQNGKFVKPDMTIEDMKKVMDGTNLNFIMKFLGKMQLPSLERWKK